MPEHSQRIFISSSPEDLGFARRLADLLKIRGASVFLGPDSITPGDRWVEVLRNEIERSDALILLIPSRSAENWSFVLFEAGAARSLGKPVFAVLPPEHASSSIDLPTDIAGLLILDSDRRSLESIADMLLQAISGENAPSGA